MQYTPRIAFGRWGVDHAFDAIRLRLLLEFMVQVCEAALRRYPELPDAYEAAVKHGLRYFFEQEGGDARKDSKWSDALAILEDNFTECKGLAAYRCAVLRVRYGIDAECKLIETWNPAMCRYEYHAVIELPDGTREDISRALGMEAR